MVGRDNLRIRHPIGLVLWSCGLPVGVCRETFRSFEDKNVFLNLITRIFNFCFSLFLEFMGSETWFSLDQLDNSAENQVSSNAHQRSPRVKAIQTIGLT